VSLPRERSQRYNPRPAGGWYMTTNEVARVLQVSSMTVYRLIEAGELAAVRVGKTWRVQEDELERFLRDAERTAA
jgi:excisionase family DNA binding protein